MIRYPSVTVPAEGSLFKVVLLPFDRDTESSELQHLSVIEVLQWTTDKPGCSVASVALCEDS